jgi:hypothetical protein
MMDAQTWSGGRVMLSDEIITSTSLHPDDMISSDDITTQAYCYNN